MQELIDKVKLQMNGRGIKTLDDTIIESEIECAAEFINNLRNFIPSQSLIVENKYKNILVKMVVFAISKYGAEGESSHGELDISRVYKTDGEYPLALIRQIIPKAR